MKCENVNLCVNEVCECVNECEFGWTAGFARFAPISSMSHTVSDLHEHLLLRY